MVKFYTPKYKRLLILPAILAVIFIFLIFVYPKVTLGLDFSGGTRIILQSSQHLDSGALEKVLRENFQLTDLKISSVKNPVGGESIRIEYAENTLISAAKQNYQTALQLKTSEPDQAKALCLQALEAVGNTDPAPSALPDLLEFTRSKLFQFSSNFTEQITAKVAAGFNIPEKDLQFTIEEVSPSLGASFWGSAITVAIASAILLIIVIFVFFRELIPSLAVIEAAIFDVLTALAAIALLGIPLNITSIAALLTLVGYSVDTDILLTTRLLKQKESGLLEMANESLATGLTMTLTTLAAVLSMLLLSYFTQIVVIYEIATILFFGLIGDMIATWFMNAPVLLSYLEKKGVALE